MSLSDGGTAARVFQLLVPGTFFAYDTRAVDGGDVLYGEVITRTAQGYLVRVHHEKDVLEGTPDGVEDFYPFREVGDRFVRLTVAQMHLARWARWPPARAFVECDLGVALP